MLFQTFKDDSDSLFDQLVESESEKKTKPKGQKKVKVMF